MSTIMMACHLSINMAGTERLRRWPFFHYKVSMAVHDRALGRQEKQSSARTNSPLGLHVRAGGTVGEGGTKRCREASGADRRAAGSR